MPPRLRPVPSAGSSRARAAPSPLVLLPPPRGVYIGHAPGLGCASRGSRCPTRPATVQRDPRAGGARAHRDARRGSTWSRDPPGHAPHARRARGRRARAPPWGLGVVRSGQLGAARCCGCRGPPACLGGSPEGAGHLSRVPGGLEREIPNQEAATEPPAAGFGAWRGVRRSGPHSEVRGILISVLGLSGPSLYGSGPGHVSISHLGRLSWSRAPRRSARHTAGSAPTKSRPRGLRAILADQKGLQ